MSKKSLDQFIQQITNSEELQVRIGEAIETDALIALGTEHGCEFSAEDVQAVWGVSDDDLDGVVGGAAYIKFDGVRGGFAVGNLFDIGTKYNPGKGKEAYTEVEFSGGTIEKFK
jgi:predicted ribosomally synthesized peptide with nif11-like leader|tara:strand:- start:229 stop:570 length:342 start_codon:yes stop_codon:yes gene_type:complete